jgi:hypothetical protein
VVIRLHIDVKKPLLFIMPVFVCLALVASLVIFPVQADEPEVAQKPQLAPVSTKFAAYRQNPPAEFYGYVPAPVDFSHLKNIPVKRQTPGKERNLPGSFTFKSNVTPAQPRPTQPPSAKGNVTSPQPEPTQPPAAKGNVTSPQPEPTQPPAATGNVTSPQPEPTQPPSTTGNVTSPQPEPTQPPSATGNVTSSQPEPTQPPAATGNVTCSQPRTPASGDKFT